MTYNITKNVLVCEISTIGKSDTKKYKFIVDLIKNF